jgi:hypothetical protein
VLRAALRAGIALAVAAVPAAAALPPNPTIVPRIVASGPGYLVAPHPVSGGIAWVVDPGGAAPRSVEVARGRFVGPTSGEAVRGQGALLVDPNGLAVPAPTGDADLGGTVLATAAAGQLQISAPGSPAPPLTVDRGASLSGVRVRGSAVFYVRDGALVRYDLGAGAATPLVPVAPGTIVDGVDGDAREVVYSTRTGSRASLFVQALPTGTPRLLRSARGILQGPVIVGNRVVVRERTRSGRYWIDRIISIDVAKRRPTTLLQRFDLSAGRRFLGPPERDGSRILVSDVQSRDPLGSKALVGDPDTLPSGLRTVVLELPAR